MAKRSDKRVRLISAAKELFYQQGFSNTTIADIAKLADVPLGNVYYYFKTKDEICAAVIKERSIEINTLVTQLNTLSSAEEKLVAFVNHYQENAEQIAKYGNIFSSLIQELSRQSSSLVNVANEILVAITNWLTEQFASLSNSENAKNQALKFLASLEGMQVLALSFQDAAIIASQAELIKAEVKALTVAQAA